MSSNDPIEAVKAAFEPGASTIEVAQGEQVLSSLLEALRAKQAMGATPNTAPATGAKAEADTGASAPPIAPAVSPLHFMLDTVVDFLKEQIDDEDWAAIEAEVPPFSIPYINTNPQGV